MEYLYGTYSGDMYRSVVEFRITKKTPKRVYYIRSVHRYGDEEEIETGYVNRETLERDGEIYNRGVHWCMDDYHLLEFVAAYTRYERALRRQEARR